LHARPALRSAFRPHSSGVVRLSAASSLAIDLVGDGGVLKVLEVEGAGAVPRRGATVEVHYEGRLVASGERFDSSRVRGKTFSFTLGEGKVIGGWEVGLSSMKAGEKAKLVCSPQYAYGPKGIPPTIPPDATLEFDVELISIKTPQSESTSFADDNPLSPRTPKDIAQAYERKLASKEDSRTGIDGFLDWAKSIYIFGFFADEKGELPPWYLNPLITFPSIFVVVGIGFYLVVALGGLHRGEVAPYGDDISAFIND